MGGRGGDSSKIASSAVEGKSKRKLYVFTKFKDKVLGKGWDSYEYDGDGSKQIDFFKNYSNAYELMDKMNSREKRAFLIWAEGEFMDGQQYKGWDNMTSREQQLTEIYDKILDKSVLKRGVEVRRYSTAELVLGAGNKTATLAELKAAEGKIVTSAGSMSFGAAATGLGIGDDSKQIEYVLKIPGGSKGSGMWTADSRIHGWGIKQLEFMTNRDIAMKVGKTTYDASRGKYVVELRYEGRMEHDYGQKKKKKKK